MTDRNDTPDFETFNRIVTDCPTIEEALDAPCTSRPCATCPYRRTPRSWLNAWRYLVNVFRLRAQRVQDCHNAPGVKCAGAVTAIAGGSADVYSPEEFERLSIAPNIFAARVRYDADRDRAAFRKATGGDA